MVLRTPPAFPFLASPSLAFLSLSRSFISSPSSPSSTSTTLPTDVTDAISTISSSLPISSISPISSIESRHDLSLAEFTNTYYCKKPVIVRGLYRDTLAKRWFANDFKYLKQWEHVMVPVEISRGTATYATPAPSSFDASGAWERVEMPLGMFLNFLSPQGLVSGYNAYLSQVSLFDLIPSLHHDIHPPLFLKAPTLQNLSPKKEEAIYGVNVWIGSNAHTPLHRDPFHNLFIQLYASKRVRMYRPEERDKLAFHSDVLLRNTSRIADIWALDQDDEVHAIKGWDGDVQQGDLLYIPQGWIHSLKGAMGVSGSINWWFR